MCLSETQSMIEEGLLPVELNDLPFNPLEILDNPLNIKTSDPDSELVKPERRQSYRKGPNHARIRRKKA